MNDETWESLVERLKQSADDVSVYSEDIAVESGDGTVRAGSRDVVEFSNERGRFMVVRENKPVLLDKKMHFSHRQGDSARTEYVFSDTEQSHKLLLYKEDDFGDWQPLESADLNAF